MKIPAEQEKNYRQGMKVRAQNHAKKLREQENHRKGLGAWMGMSGDAMKALQDMDRLDKKLAAMGALLLLSVLMASGQGYYVIEDTNQLQVITNLGLKVVYRTDLYACQTVTFWGTNWSNVDPTPKKITLPNGTLALMLKQEARLMTNVEHRITYGGHTRVWKTSQTFSQPIGTQELIVAAPPEEPFLATPLRQQR